MGTCPIRRQQNTTVLANLSDSDSPDHQESIIVSLHDHPSIGQTEPTMHIGERLTVTSDEGDFMMVYSLTTKRESYIPANYTAKVTHRWLYTGLSRLKAEELLMLPDNINGSFLIRESESSKDCYSLSILKKEPCSNVDSVKHYKISHLPNGWVYISPGVTFPSLQRLIDHYTENLDGLCCRITKPCFIGGFDNIKYAPVVIRRPTINWKDISRSVIFRRKRTGSANSLVSEGLREAISSYLQMAEGGDLTWES